MGRNQRDGSARHIVSSVAPIGPSDEPEDGGDSGSKVGDLVDSHRLLCAQTNMHRQ